MFLYFQCIMQREVSEDILFGSILDFEKSIYEIHVQISIILKEQQPT